MSEMPLLEGDTRKPTAGHLTYSKGVRPDPAVPMGPNTLGEHLWPVTVEDLGDRTRVGFSYVAPLVATA